MKASVLLCVLNEEETIGRCINSILDQDLPKDDYEVIVVDDCSTDRTPEILDSFLGSIKIFRNKKHMGLPYSRNLAVEKAGREVVCFIDGDMYAERSWLRNLTAPYYGSDVDGRVFPKEILGGVGGFIGAWNKDNILVRYSQEGGMRYLSGVHQSPEVKVSSGGFCTGNASYRRDILERVGGFDERLQFGHDFDLNVRISGLGYIFAYNPRARVYHKHPESLFELMSRWFQRGRYSRVIQKKHPSLRHESFYRPSDLRGFVSAAVRCGNPLFIPIDALVRVSALAGRVFNWLE